MNYRRCGDSGLLLPEISLGFWHNFGQGDDFQEARRIMRRAFDRGVTHFDLANNYGEWGSRKHMLSSLDQSLRRLRLPYVDVFYSHRPDPETRLEETMSALATAVNSGKALYAGLSKYPLKRLKKAVKLLKEMGIRCLVYQPPYSILNRWPEHEGILDYLLASRPVPAPLGRRVS
jgi:L-glyceraldehyde 3-phosphate reductase